MTQWTKTPIKVIRSEQGFTIAEKVRKMIQEGEPLGAGTGMNYNETFDEGVSPAHDIRTDKHALQENLISNAATQRSEYLRRIAHEGKGGGGDGVAETDAKGSAE